MWIEERISKTHSVHFAAVFTTAVRFNVRSRAQSVPVVHNLLGRERNLQNELSP